jgi:hypothetical protein
MMYFQAKYILKNNYYHSLKQFIIDTSLFIFL